MLRCCHERTFCPPKPLRSAVVRRGLAAVLVSATLLGFAGCQTTPPRARIVYTGDPVVDGLAERAAAPAKDRVMWDYRIAASALRAGHFDEAKLRLDEAIAAMGGIIAHSVEARRARGLFHGEDTKVFIGEPYERAMAYFYRGLLYWKDGQPDNARACFLSAQLLDSDAAVDAFRGDYVLFDYLDGLAATRLAMDSTEAWARAQKNSKQELPPYEPEANVLCFVEFGRGPRKYAGGEFGEQLRFATEQSRARSAVLTVAGRDVRFDPWDDLHYQATTRGGRVMDHILGNKAVFKQSADTVGDVALIGAVIAADNIYKRPEPPRPERRRLDAPRADNRETKREEGEKPPPPPEVRKNHDAQNAAIALGAIGVISKIAAAATTPKADTRAWNNLPQYLSFAALALPPGDHDGTLEFFDANGQRLPTLTRRLTLHVDDPSRDTVVFLSEHKR